MTASKSFILRSTVPAPLLAKASELIIPSFKAPAGPRHAKFHNVQVELADGQLDDGSARDYRKEGLGEYGILGLVLGLILVSGKAISDGECRHLSRSNGHGLIQLSACDRTIDVVSQAIQSLSFYSDPYQRLQLGSIWESDSHQLPYDALETELSRKVEIGNGRPCGGCCYAGCSRHWRGWRSDGRMEVGISK